MLEVAELQRTGRLYWLQMLDILSQAGSCELVESSSSSDSLQFRWARPSMRLSQEADGGLGFSVRRCRMGAMVLNIAEHTSAASNGIVLGSLIVDVNGVQVALESFESIQRRLDTMERPVCLRMLSNDCLYDAIFWDMDLGLVLCPASDVSVPSFSSP